MYSYFLSVYYMNLMRTAWSLLQKSIRFLSQLLRLIFFLYQITPKNLRSKVFISYRSGRKRKRRNIYITLQNQYKTQSILLNSYVLQICKIIVLVFIEIKTQFLIITSIQFVPILILNFLIFIVCGYFKKFLLCQKDDFILLILQIEKIANQNSIFSSSLQKGVQKTEVNNSILQQTEMLPDLKKENMLYRQYIATLEQQVKANAEQRTVLCRQLNNLGEENDNLDRRISLQSSMTVSQVALQHFQQKLKQQEDKNSKMQDQLQQALQNNKFLNNLIQLKQKQNIQLSFKTQQIPRLKIQLSQMQAILKQRESLIHHLSNELKNQKEQRMKQQPIIAAKIDLEKINSQHLQTIKKNNIEISELKIAMATLKIRNQQLTNLEDHLKELKRQKILFIQKISDAGSENSIIQLTLERLKRQYQDQREQSKAQIEKLQKEKASLLQQFDKEFNKKQQAARQKQHLLQLLKKERKQFQELSRSNKAQADNKAKLISKTYRSNGFSKTQGDFSNSFVDLKNQIQSLKLTGKNQKENTNCKQLQQKEAQYIQLNSPSKWKSVQSKLFILRSAINGRFK